MKHARPDYDRFQDPACIIPENEPVFLIRGQDLAAVPVLRYYLMTAIKVGAKQDLVDAVFQHIKRMEEWQRTVARKTPDLPVAKPVPEEE